MVQFFMERKMNDIHVVNHPLMLDKISQLRNKETGAPEFRQLIQQVSTILAVESTAHCHLEETTVATPLEITTGHRISRDIVLIPVLRCLLYTSPSPRD